MQRPTGRVDGASERAEGHGEQEGIRLTNPSPSQTGGVLWQGQPLSGFEFPVSCTEGAWSGPEGIGNE